MLHYVPLLGLLLCMSLWAKAKIDLKQGDKAPYFALYGDDERMHTRDEYRGKKIVVYFYPKNFTPGCTQEACSLRDDFDVFKRNNIEVIGISYDTVASHKDFKKKYNLPFVLLSDPKSEIFDAYGAKGMLFNSRITYIIDEAGTILKIFHHVSPATHAREIADYLKIT